jgi:HK97 family phage portal protein
MTTPSKNKGSKKKDEIITFREFKALSDLLVSNEKTFNLVRDMTGDDGSSYYDTELKAYLDARNLKNLFFTENWPYTVVDLIAMKISNQPLVICKDYPLPDGKTLTKIDANHPYQKTINEPNPWQDYHAWMYCNVVDLILIGNNVIWKGFTGLNLWQIPSDEITIDFANNIPSKYRRLALTEYNAISTISEIDPSQIIHIKRPNPNSLYWGLSPFLPGNRSILFDRYSSEYLNNYYVKGTTPGLTLEMTDAANEKSAVRMLKSIEMAYSGRKAQRRTMILPKGVTAKNVATTLADQQLGTFLDRNRENLLALLKVPKHEVGLQTSGSLGSEEYKQALKNFWSTTIQPTMRMIEGSLSKGLKENLGEGYYFRFDISDVEILKDDLIKKAGLAREMLQIHTLNEVRQELYDKQPVDGGDVVQSLQKPTGMPFTFSLPTGAVESKAIEENAGDVMIKAHKNWFDARSDKIARQVKEPTKNLIDLSANLIMNQIKEVVAELTKEKKSKAPGDEQRWRNLIENALRQESFRKQWINDYLSYLSTTINFGYDLALDVPFKLPANDELIAIGDNTKNKRNAILRTRGLATFETMNGTTTNEVMDIIKSGIEDQLTIQKMTAQIAEKYQDVDNVLYRAERIARTETLTAASMGQAAAMKDAKELMPDLQKMWISATDERVRGNPSGEYPNSKTDHWHLHGQIVDSQDPFEDTKSGDLLMFPRDPNAKLPGSVINCRCAFVMMPKSDMDKFKKDPSAKPN